MHSIASIIHGHKPKRQKTQDLRPLAFIRFNTRLRKPKPVTLTALLDSGGSESLIRKEHVKHLRARKLSEKGEVWTTPGGSMTTTHKAKCQLTIPELQDRKLIEWDMHAADNLGRVT